jgi:hypothetical protein
MSLTAHQTAVAVKWNIYIALEQFQKWKNTPEQDSKEHGVCQVAVPLKMASNVHSNLRSLFSAMDRRSLTIWQEKKQHKLAYFAYISLLHCLSHDSSMNPWLLQRCS